MDSYLGRSRALCRPTQPLQSESRRPQHTTTKLVTAGDKGTSLVSTWAPDLQKAHSWLTISAFGLKLRTRSRGVTRSPCQRGVIIQESCKTAMRKKTPGPQTIPIRPTADTAWNDFASDFPKGTAIQTPPASTPLGTPLCPSSRQERHKKSC